MWEETLEREGGNDQVGGTGKSDLITKCIFNMYGIIKSESYLKILRKYYKE